MNSIADIPINNHLGMKYDKVNQKLSLPETEVVMNLFGQVSYCAQFTLAEASSAQFLFDKLGLDLTTDIPTLRKTTTKFHKPTNGESICNLVSLEHTRNEFQELLERKRKIMTNIEVEVPLREWCKISFRKFSMVSFKEKFLTSKSTQTATRSRYYED